MNKWIQGAAVTALLAFSVLCVGLTYEVANIGNELRTDAHSITVQTTAQIASLSKTQQQLDKLLYNTKRLVEHADITETKESAMLDHWNTQLTSVIGNVNESVATLNKNQNELTAHSVSLLDSGTAELDELRRTTTQATVTLSTANDSVQHLDTLITTPVIPEILDNTNEVAKQTAGTMAHVNHTSANVDEMVDAVAHPTWIAKIMGIARDWGMDIVTYFAK